MMLVGLLFSGYTPVVCGNRWFVPHRHFDFGRAVALQITTHADAGRPVAGDGVV